MSEPFDVESLQQMTELHLHEHLDHFTDLLIDATERPLRFTMRGTTFTAAVGGVALLEAHSLAGTAQKALRDHDGLEAVTNWWPALANRGESDWREALRSAWQTVRFDRGARRPSDHSEIGYIELLEAIRKGNAHYRSVRVR